MISGSDSCLPVGADESEGDNAAAVAAFSRVVAYCVTETCRRALVLGHFGEALAQGSCTGCDCCEQPDTVRAQVWLAARVLAAQLHTQT